MVLLTKLRRDLLAQWGSLLALTAIMAIGAGSCVGMRALHRDTDCARSSYYAHQNLADIVVNLRSAPEWAVQQAQSLTNISILQGRINEPVLLDIPGLDLPVAGSAISVPLERRPMLNDVLLRQGMWFEGSGEGQVILIDAFARANGLRPGDRIRALLPDRQHDLLIVGTAMAPEFVYLLPADGGLAPDPARFGVLYMPEEILQRAADREGAWTQVLGRVLDRSPEALKQTLEALETHLDDYGVTLTSTMADQPSVRFLADELDGLATSSLVMPSIFLGVAALILHVLMGRLVARERMIIGTLKAVGYSRGAIMLLYLAHGAAVGLLGGLAGLALGHGLHQMMIAMYQQFFALPGLAARMHPDIMLLGVAVSIAFATMGSSQGAWLAARLDPAESMRPPAPAKGGRIWLEYFQGLWRRLPFQLKLTARNMLRHPMRSAASMIAAMIATALIVMMTSMLDSLDILMRHQFERVSREDMTVILRDPQDALGGVREIEGLPGVSVVEGTLDVPCDLRYGLREKRMGVIGLPVGHQLHMPLDGSGNRVAIPPSGLVLSRKLAEILDVHVGDPVQMRPLMGERREVQAVVSGIVDTYLGLAAYASLDYLARLLGEQAVSNTLLMRLEPGLASAERAGLMAALRERPSVTGVSERMRALEQMQKTFGETMGANLSVMVLFAGAIAFGGVLNTALVSLSERRRDIATLRVLGYTPRQVGVLFATESLILNLMGVALGVVAGVIAAHLMAQAFNTELFRFPAVVTPTRMITSAAIVMVFIGIAQVIIFRLIRTLDWLEAVKSRE